MRRLACISLIAVLPILAVSPVLAQSRTPWQMHDGLEVNAGNPYGLVPFACVPSQHGDPCEYDVAMIPPENDPGWGPAPDGEIIGFSIYPSRVCSAPISCLAYGDFTYFQTLVDVPANLVVTTFTIDFSGIDDGARVTIFNSAYPTGLVVPGSYVFLYGTGTANLKDYVVSGEVNRVVVTQVDDCCIENNLRSAVVVLNGTPVVTNRPPDCSLAVACEATLWPPDHKYRQVSICGVTDPEGDPVTIAATGVTQDEPIEDRGDGSTCPDAAIQNGVASVRVERSGVGNGRVYVISFIATDARGGSCSGSVPVCVPHDQDVGHTCVDDGQTVNSMGTCITGRMQGAQPDDLVTGVGLRVLPVSAGVGKLEYSLPEESDVVLAVYDLAGRRVRTLVNSRQTAESHQTTWNSGGLSRGIYYYRMQAAGRTLTKSVYVK